MQNPTSTYASQKVPPFRKTTLYRDTLAVVDEFTEALRIKGKDLMVKIVEAEAATLMSALAKGLSANGAESGNENFNKAQHAILSLISLLDVSAKYFTVAEKETLEEKLSEVFKNIKNYGNTRKKILILTCHIGKGNFTAGNAVAEAIGETYGYDYDVEEIDFMEFINSAVNKFTKTTYEGSVKFTPFFYKFFFESTNTKWPYKLINQLNYPFVINKLKTFFEEKKPDLIISTFPLWDYVTSEIWRKYNKEAKFISIITDSTTIHKFWLVADVDYHIVCNEDTARVLEKYGVKREKIKVLGFPVRLDFTKKPDRKEFLKKYGLNPRKKIILFSPTAQTLRKNTQIMEELIRNESKFNILVVTGRDNAIKHKLEKIARNSGIQIFGWTEEMPRFIQNADIVVTKAGGATVMECIAAAKPMMITSVIPGHEKGNADLIVKNRLGIVLKKDLKDLKYGLGTLQKNYNAYRNNLKKLSRPDAAIKIAEFIHQFITSKKDRPSAATNEKAQKK
jgi:UDP-N-acetylglucosamine:LPS N-acetylglucosamine transferase